MGDFFDNSILGVRRGGSKDSGVTEMHDLVTPNGVVVANIRATVLDMKFKAIKTLKLPVATPLNAEFLSTGSRVVLRMIRPFAFNVKEWMVTLQDEQRRVLARLTRVPTATRTDSGTYDYSLTDVNNTKICLIRGNWRLAGQLQILDDRGGSVGKIGRKDVAMGPGYTTDPKFHVVNCYAPPQSANHRLSLIGVAAGIDFIVD